MLTRLRYAYAVSLLLHLAVLFGPLIELPEDPLPPVISATLLQAPLSSAEIVPAKHVTKPEKAKPTSDKTGQRPKQNVSTDPAVPSQEPLAPKEDVASSTADMASQAVASSDREMKETVAAASNPSEPLNIKASPLPRSGALSYRVDRGDRGFEIGETTHEWTIQDGRYRLVSKTSTTGLAKLIKSVVVEMISEGTMTAAGLRPDSFVVRRNGNETGEKASFDWQAHTVANGAKLPVPVADGAQDLLSFMYQLPFMPDVAAGVTFSVATGKKYELYHLEVVGNEDIEIPAFKSLTVATLHLKASGSSTTELWLAYDYRLLPVKIRFVDNRGDVYVQTVTQIYLDPTS